MILERIRAGRFCSPLGKDQPPEEEGNPDGAAEI